MVLRLNAVASFQNFNFGITCYTILVLSYFYGIITLKIIKIGGLNLAHLKKFDRNATGHLAAHFERKQNIDGNYVKFGNQNIDLNKTHLNYNLAPNRSDQIEFIKNRCNEVKCLNRKDVKVMCSWVITKPQGIKESEEELFFKESYRFLENRYGKENVISSYVHKDEITPHMHFAFVPVVYDKKKEIYKVSAKEKITRNDLKTFHKDLEKHLEKTFDREIGILNEATREGNKSINELKRLSATSEVEMTKHTIEVLKTEYRGLESFLGQYKNNNQTYDMYPDYVQIKNKGIINKQKYVSLPLEKWEEKLKYLYLSDSYKRENEFLKKELEELKNAKPIKELKAELKKVEKEKSRAESSNYNLRIKVFKLENKINNIFKLEPKIKDLLQEQKQKRIEKEMDLER